MESSRSRLSTPWACHRRCLGCASGRGFASGIQEWSTYVRRQFHRVMPRLIRARSSHHGSRSVARREARPRGTGPNRTFLLNRKEEKTTMRVDLKPGNTFPDIELPNHDNETVTLSSLVRGFPTVLVFSRGYF